MSPHRIQRDLSHRKPVPKFIPSPPPSPQVVLAPTPLYVDKDVPPLPKNWRDVIERAVSIDEYSSTYARSTEGPDVVTPPTDGAGRQILLNRDVKKAGSDLDSLTSPPDSVDGDIVSRPESTIPWSPGPQLTTRRSIGAVLDIRPPTPPLPSQRNFKWQRSASSETHSAVPSIASQVIGPEKPLIAASGSDQHIPLGFDMQPELAVFSQRQNQTSTLIPASPANSMAQNAYFTSDQGIQRPQSMSRKPTSTCSSSCTPALTAGTLSPSSVCLDKYSNHGPSNVEVPGRSGREGRDASPRVAGAEEAQQYCFEKPAARNRKSGTAAFRRLCKRLLSIFACRPGI